MTTFATEQLDRYLRAIRFLLSPGEREDILRELRANLEAEFEDRASEKGRGLTEDEVIALLCAHGSPASVAARYQPQSYLIGPAMWPYFWLGTKALALAVAVAATFQTLVGIAAQESGWLWALLPARWPLAFLNLALPVFAVWVLLMALAERGWASRKEPQDWDPRKLDKEGFGVLVEDWAGHLRRGGASVAGTLANLNWPDASLGRSPADPSMGKPAEKAAAATSHARICKPEASFSKAFGELFGAVVAFVAWMVCFHFSGVLTGGALTNLSPAPIWAENYSFVMGLLLVQIGIAVIPLFQPSSRVLFQLSKAVSNAISIAILVPFLKAPALLVIGSVGEGVKDLTRVGTLVNTWAYPVLWVTIICTAIAAAVQLGKALAALFGPCGSVSADSGSRQS